jgi:single-strand DNA-binding protein
MNIVIFKGNMTKDIDIKYTTSNKMVGSFSVAINEKYKDKETTHFIECAAWEKSAEFVSKYFKKGDPIIVEGKLAQQSWTDKDTGKNRSKLLVIVNKVDFCGGQKSKVENTPDTYPQSHDDGLNVPFSDEDIPF